MDKRAEQMAGKESRNANSAEIRCFICFMIHLFSHMSQYDPGSQQKRAEEGGGGGDTGEEVGGKKQRGFSFLSYFFNLRLKCVIFF